ncbi:hypothetical protein D9619_012955 [Psilocybe cf. subviscida]|uniref:Chromatin modification-related protein n=1 Tax=Psilocybe cf. subviscida TaxID=2480587 RepID=A0A8H5BKA6_9AGAR|nr:hypothetical protein D9619_012955 [Psilocybe cf. subviscida]
MATLGSNYEEAANVASEFIYSELIPVLPFTHVTKTIWAPPIGIDNLPGEVAHLLQEIKHHEARAQELQQEIDKESLKYITQSRSSGTSSPAPTAGLKVSALYAEVQQISTEKCSLAERLVEIINRTRAKLDVDIVKVRTLQGESPASIVASMARQSQPVLSISMSSGTNAAMAISDSLRNGLALAAVGGISAADLKRAAATAAAPSPPANKKRRVTQTASIKISPAASPAPTTAHTQQKSRLSRQVHSRTVVEEELSEDMNLDEDGEGEEEGEEEAEDETPYCFCRKSSYGEMIACDNVACQYEWFHLACVGLKEVPSAQWYCEVCKPDMTPPPPPPPTGGRKGRKK